MVDEFRLAFLKYSRPSYVCSVDELNVVLRLTHAAQSVLAKRHVLLIAACQDQPLLHCYQSDGWSTKISTLNVATDGEQVVMNKGRFRHEFILERSATRSVHYSGRHDLTFSYVAPRALLTGHTHLEFFSAACDFSHTLRNRGHRGAAITVYIFDRLLFSSMMRLLNGRHELFYDREYGSCPPDVFDFLRNLKLFAVSNALFIVVKMHVFGR
jgi:hypothetical protein